MSEQPNTRPKVPEGKTRYLITRQKEPNEKGYVGFDTIWESFQKEVEYTTPKRPYVTRLREPKRSRGRYLVDIYRFGSVYSAVFQHGRKNAAST